MYAWRYLDDQYTEDPDFIFNKPEYRKATILITGDNFRGWFLSGARGLGFSRLALKSLSPDPSEYPLQ